jgi:hypothetical protein
MDISHMAPGAPSTLGDLLSPVTSQEFFNSVDGKKPVHIPGRPDKFAFAMSWEILNGILDQSVLWSPYGFQLILDKVTLRPEQYTRDGIGRDGRPTLLVDFEKARAFIRQGASIVLNEIETLTPGMKRIADILGREPGGKVQGNLYCSWLRHQAFDVHYDTHDVFAMQITGEKIWRIYQRHFKDPINHPAFKMHDAAFHHANKGPLSMEVMMRPGDLIYIPRGFYHEALAESDATVHMSFSVVQMIGLDVISMLFEYGVLDDAFRQAVPQPGVREGKALDEYLMRMAGRIREILRDPIVRAQIETAIRGFRHPTDRIDLPGDAKKP